MAEVSKTLHPLEKKILTVLKGEFSIKALETMTGLQEIEIVRAGQWLQNKGLAKINEDPKEMIALDKNGKSYKHEGLPELRFLKGIQGKTKVSEISKKQKLSKEEIGVSLGILKKKIAVKITKEENELIAEITEQGKKLAKTDSLEEKFLHKNYPINLSSLSAEEKYAYETLKKRRNIVKTDLVKNRTIAITEEGKKLQTKGISTKEEIEKLTPNMIREGSWKGKSFRSYDVEINVPKIFAGKSHAYADFIYQARQKLSVMGFKEMTGPTVELEFYNFDALYQPQNHAARGGNDTYNINMKGTLPEAKLVKKVKEAHEKGTAKSKGWRYSWSGEIASKLLARAHDTAITPRYLSKGVESPGKYYSLVRCYRPDVIDSSHGVEFNQMGGFVIGKELSFAHLLGLLKQFAAEMTGAKEFKFFPDYFPFTEPSVQISAKTEYGWMELCGAGVFRPEMCEALGIKEPVIAWGFGIDRLAMLKLGVKDIRNLFSKDLNYLREQKKVNL